MQPLTFISGKRQRTHFPCPSQGDSVVGSKVHRSGAWCPTPSYSCPWSSPSNPSVTWVGSLLLWVSVVSVQNEQEMVRGQSCEEGLMGHQGDVTLQLHWYQYQTYLVTSLTISKG